MNSQDYTVVIACRNIGKAAIAQKNLRQETGNPNIYALKLDLASLKSVRNFYKDFCHEKYPPLYALVCNAGVHSTGHLAYTEDGFEEAFGVNHLGHYLLVNLMLNQMIDNGRIIFVTSDMHDFPKFPSSLKPVFKNSRSLAYPHESCEDYGYSASKLCNILCTYEMSNRLASETDKHITVNAFNPGFMPDTRLSEIMGPFIPRLISIFAWIIGSSSNAKRSGKALAAMITDNRYEHTTGTYNDRGKITKSSKASYDKEAARRLWVESAEMVKLRQDESVLSTT